MLLELKNISKSYFKPDGSLARRVLIHLSLQMHPNESISIVGPSGCGKTTLLNLIATLDRPDEGSIYMACQELGLLQGKHLDRFRNESIGIVFQQHHLLPQLSLLENVLLPTVPQKKKGSELNDRAQKLLERLGIWEQRHQKPGELSGGECQRAAVARALINQPQLLIADEPTGALDEENAENLADLLFDIHQEFQTGLILVTHSQNLAQRAQSKYVLEKGKLIKQ